MAENTPPDPTAATLPPSHAAAELFPLIEGDELAALVEDIRSNGLIEPVWMWQDPELGELLLDGRNRWRACASAGVPVAKRRYEGDDPIGFVISENLQRRHLTVGQKAGVLLRSLPMYEAEAAKRMLAGKPSDPGADLPQGDDESKKRAPRARDKAAKTAGISGRSLAQSKRIAEQAPDLAAKVDAGTMALDRADRIIRDREAAQRKIEEAQQEAAAQTEPTSIDLRRGDFREVLADLTGVDAIITDPPYGAEFVPLLGNLAAWADRVLTDDGVLAVLMGQTHLPEVYRLLDGYRPYRWTACYLTEGPGYVSHPRRVQSNWKPLIVFGGGPRFADVIRSHGTDADAKNLHKWGQDYGAFHTIVERLTKKGQTVADPFMGAGTTLLAARALGRNVVGCDIDPAAVETARGRLG